ncbi:MULTISPECIES: F0F1 ATP synthase subunit B family protein [Sphingobium]|jgi:F-type H+-transporting ATPase subunit b|uniref:F0F1 ATP synthase subunit B family protein n=1 Tax=Sphingobium TaxID=165695 RepID=UPI000DBB05A2|nr:MULTISPECIES: ATPase [Sphingobium]KAA9018614.1 ATPase [Sphingobium limneticum]MBU0933676.1 ATPase [Alphaproteobacteria bacterium]BBC99624.1 F-type H+-transporting ATPase subunit b [Sphingobium sp. YG1]
MPQIAQIAETYSSQIFWLLLTFGFVFFVIGLGMVPKVQGTADARDAKISGDLDAAKAAFARADEAEADYRTRDAANRAAAQATLAKSKSEAAKASEVRLAAADAEVATKIAAAEARIKGASDAAMAEIETVAADAARDMVARISGVDASDDAARNAVKAALAHG